MWLPQRERERGGPAHQDRVPGADARWEEGACPRDGWEQDEAGRTWGFRESLQIVLSPLPAGVGNSSDGILVLGATNIPWVLDSAIRRR